MVQTTTSHKRRTGEKSYFGCRTHALTSFHGDRLSGILRKRTLSDEKLDEIKLRSNVISAFVTTAAKKLSEGVRIETATEAASSAAEAVETEAKRVKEEL
jgi:hypothetical protein